jgi:hypothetical protein
MWWHYFINKEYARYLEHADKIDRKPPMTLTQTFVYVLGAIYYGVYDVYLRLSAFLGAAGGLFRTPLRTTVGARLTFRLNAHMVIDINVANAHWSMTYNQVKCSYGY